MVTSERRAAAPSGGSCSRALRRASTSTRSGPGALILPNRLIGSGRPGRSPPVGADKGVWGRTGCAVGGDLLSDRYPRHSGFKHTQCFPILCCKARQKWRFPASERRTAAGGGSYAASVEFNPLKASSLADPYPRARDVPREPARLLRGGPRLLGRHAACGLQASAARVRDVLGLELAVSARGTVPKSRKRARGRRVPLDADADQRRSSGAHAHPPHRAPRVHAPTCRADGGLRPRAGPEVPRRAPARRARGARLRAHLGAARARGVPRSRNARGRRRDGEAGLGQPAAVHVREADRGRAGRHRHRHGVVLALLRRAR